MLANNQWGAVPDLPAAGYSPILFSMQDNETIPETFRVTAASQIDFAWSAALRLSPGESVLSCVLTSKTGATTKVQDFIRGAIYFVRLAIAIPIGDSDLISLQVRTNIGRSLNTSLVLICS